MVAELISPDFQRDATDATILAAATASLRGIKDPTSGESMMYGSALTGVASSGLAAAQYLQRDDALPLGPGRIEEEIAGIDRVPFGFSGDGSMEYDSRVG